MTGAGGFIGSHLVEALARAGATVRAFVRYNSRGDYGWLEAADPDVVAARSRSSAAISANPEAVAGAVAGREVVFHLGALIPIPYSYRHPREFVTANVERHAERARGRAPGGGRRGSSTPRRARSTAPRRPCPIDEEHPLHPQSPYAATKVGADQLALSFQRSFGTPVVVARPFNTFGPRQSARAVIPTIISQALARDVIELGATEPTRDFLYVEDTARGLMRCAEADGIEGEVINLGTGIEISIGDVVERVLASSSTRRAGRRSTRSASARPTARSSG